MHAAVLLLLSTTPKGKGAPEVSAEAPPKISNPQLLSKLIYATNPKVASQTFHDLIIQPPAAQKHVSPAATTAAATSASSAVRSTASEAPASLKNLPTVSADIDQARSLYGLGGKSNITYWPSDEVDEAALMLAEWPEGVSTSAWPPGQFVRLELWINPDGALAEIAFSQKDLPDSLRITLVEIISHAGFKPAVKNGEPVGNHRVLEMLLSQISVPPLVKY
ncbi:MAG: hypothetical protein EAZ34_08830 [Polaromonas sp.]|nr:MAG: hypothetical protein EAZ34_08830 [Polaromonas sp.]